MLGRTSAVAVRQLNSFTATKSNAGEWRAEKTFHLGSHNGAAHLCKALNEAQNNQGVSSSRDEVNAIMECMHGGAQPTAGECDRILGFIREKSIDINFADSRGNTLLHLAANGGGRDIMKEVIAAQCSAVNVDGVSEAEVIGAVKEYLSQPNDQGETALMAAVRNKNLEMVKELIKYGADLSVIGGDLLNRVGGEIQEYLNEAIEAQEVMNGIMERSPSLTKDDWKTIEGFVDEGLIDINFMDQNGNTLSGLAYDHGELDMWRKLVRAAN